MTRLPQGYPREGDHVSIVTADVVEAAVIVEVEADRRAVHVATETAAEPIRFELSRATGRFTADDGTRLSFATSPRGI